MRPALNGFPRLATSVSIAFGPLSWLPTNRQEIEMALSETLKNILEVMANSPMHGVADVADVAESGNTALATPSSATPPLGIRCGSGVADVADTQMPHLPHAACKKSVAKQQ